MMFVLVLFFLLLCMCSFVSCESSLGVKEDANTSSCIEMERIALLSFKENLVDINNNLNNWGSQEENKDCCKWTGVNCSNQTLHVITLDLSTSSNGITGKISPSLPLLKQLEYLDLSGIDFQSNPIPDFLGSLANLRHLDLSSTNLSGRIPHQLSNLSNLLHLDLRRNFLEGSVPFRFGDLTSLTYLDLSKNNLNESLPNFSGFSSLSKLFLGYNSFNGNIPDLIGCQSLQVLDLSSNQLTGNLPNSVGQLSNLSYLDVSSNSLKGVISDVHFLNLTSLTYLDMSFNSFTFELSSHFEIPSQLETVKLQSCKLGPSFPAWIQTQNQFQHLDISRAEISDTIPVWFWNLPSGLKFVDLSSNELRGMLPNMTSNFGGYPGIDLSYNQLEGRIPLLPSKLSSLKLSRNRFSGNLSSLCQIDKELTLLDLSNNLLSGRLPDCWLKFQKRLVVLNLSNNTLSGEIPSSLGFLSQLEALYLRSNAFVGELPISLSNCTKLRFADFGENKLSGIIPTWIGERLSNLSFLVLRSNNFSGGLPSELCWLSNLQVLHLSKNGFSGNIPRCFGNFTAMVKRTLGDDVTNHSYNSFYHYNPRLSCSAVRRCTTEYEKASITGPLALGSNYQSAGDKYNALSSPSRGCSSVKRCDKYNALGSPSRGCSSVQRCALISSIGDEIIEGAVFIDNAMVPWKGTERNFEKVSLQLLKSIDLSDNKLSGELPYEITRLHELVSLNLSINKLHGELPKDMGRLNHLDSLDLSGNKFSGNIPSSLSEITYLGYLNLSNNNFSGRIPTGSQLQRFDCSSYTGNPHLHGPPLTPGQCGLPPATINVGKEHNEEEVVDDDDDDDDDDDGDELWESYYIGMGTGFIVGFWGICATIFLNRSCRHFLFASLIRIKDWMYVTVALHRLKLQRMFKRF